MQVLTKLQRYFYQPAEAASLATLRIFFGLIMLFGIIRFWFKGWIETLYIEPSYHFKYYGFNWIDDLGENVYFLFIICGLSSILITIGLFYRFAIIIFFASFTYIELIDKTTYLNHYYFVSILSLLLCFIPLNSSYSFDNIIFQKKRHKVYLYHVLSIKTLVFIVYLYAGLAKINSDWLLKALPLSIWLPSKYDIPVLGDLFFNKTWVHYLMSWGGMIYDLSIPFFLLYKNTRFGAFLIVIIFHILTAVLFPIGMFPYIMIIVCLIFFSDKFHLRYLNKISFDFKKFPVPNKSLNKFSLNFFFISLIILSQILIPIRHRFYPGELFWHEQGYRFSWRVMLMEKRGYTQFKIVDSVSKKQFFAKNDNFLTEFQEKQMSFQPDFILEYANHLGNYYNKEGFKNIQVYADSYVALNGRISKRFINPNKNLYGLKDSFKNKKWILAFDDEIFGF